MKKNAEINKKLNVIANYDALTGLMNRNCYNDELERLSKEVNQSFVCIYVDVNGLHELNNHLGHRSGDEMLKTVADELRHAFSKDSLYRIGGDEFVIFCKGRKESEIRSTIEEMRKALRKRSYEISVGIALHEQDCNVMKVIGDAEAAMQEDKRIFYQQNGNERRMRVMNKQIEQMIMEKQDADTFLEVLAPEFKGVYFVNLGKDTIRHIYIPPYFEECLEEAKDQFGKALLLYAKRIVKPEYYDDFKELCNYTKLEEQLDSNHAPELIYQKIGGEWLKLRILKFKEYTSKQRETLWIFTNLDRFEG